MDINIRKATRGDWKLVQSLNAEVFDDNSKYDDALDPNWTVSKKGIAYFKKVTSSPKYYCSIAEIEGNPVGYLIGMDRVYSYRKVRLSEIDTIGVSPEFRSKGIGAELIRAYRAWAKEHGFDRIYVNAYYLNDKAIAFYKRQGLSPIDISFEGRV